ncbi:MAG: hypothetical protein AAF989_07240 [Planctomycetota bacterium]
MNNPYRATIPQDVPADRDASIGVMLVLLAVLFVTTLVSTASIVAIAWHRLSVIGVAFAILSGLYQLPGLWLANRARRRPSVLFVPSLGGAWVIALAGGFIGVKMTWSFYSTGPWEPIDLEMYTAMVVFQGVMVVFIYVGCGIATMMLHQWRRDLRTSNEQGAVQE